MYKFKILFTVLLIGSLSSYSLHAQTGSSTVKTLDELLSRVIEGKNADSAENSKRLQRFINAHDQQKRLLSDARARTIELERIGESINKEIIETDRELDILDLQLSDALGNFGELFGVTRQVAGDTRAQINNSLISAQYPGRDVALAQIASSKKMPTMNQLRTLWVTLLQEQSEQGKVERFSAIVSDKKGHPETRNVVRVGPFAAISKNEYLVYNAAGNELKTLAKQPDSRYTKSAKQLSNADSNNLVNVAIDPSRGTILSLLVQAPSLYERFKQGGIPGYVVSFLAIIGLGIGFTRLFALYRISSRVQRQMKIKTIRLDNPMGRVLNAYKENPSLDLEALELKLEDAVLKEIPSLDRGLSTMKVLAAVAPLIGLLGTVVGMILTFQAITLWGTGEPKIMAGGISQALVTTVQGLIAAIPLLLLHSVTNGRARLVQQVLEEQSAGLIARRAEKIHEK